MTVRPRSLPLAGAAFVLMACSRAVTGAPVRPAASSPLPAIDQQTDSARLQEPRLARFWSVGAPSGAVRMGSEWVLLEAGDAPVNAGRASRWLRARAPSSRVTMGLVTRPMARAGGAAWLAGEHRNIYVAPASVRTVQASVREGRQAEAYVVGVHAGRWLRVDGDSLWAEPIDLPDAPGSLVIYVPSLRWVYSSLMASPPHRDLLLRHARERGWPVSRIGSPANMAEPAN